MQQINALIIPMFEVALLIQLHNDFGVVVALGCPYCIIGPMLELLAHAFLLVIALPLLFRYNVHLGPRFNWI